MTQSIDSPRCLTASIRFYAELNDFWPVQQRQKPLTYTFNVSASITSLIEALGVPHPEIDLILVTPVNSSQLAIHHYFLRPQINQPTAKPSSGSNTKPQTL